VLWSRRCTTTSLAAQEYQSIRSLAGLAGVGIDAILTPLITLPAERGSTPNPAGRPRPAVMMRVTSLLCSATGSFSFVQDATFGSCLILVLGFPLVALYDVIRFGLSAKIWQDWPWFVGMMVMFLLLGCGG
jgi:hypothetical protein